MMGQNNQGKLGIPANCGIAVERPPPIVSNAKDAATFDALYRRVYGVYGDKDGRCMPPVCEDVVVHHSFLER